MRDRSLDSIRAQMRNTKEPIENRLIESGEKHAASCRYEKEKMHDSDYDPTQNMQGLQKPILMIHID